MDNKWLRELRLETKEKGEYKMKNKSIETNKKVVTLEGVTYTHTHRVIK